MQYMQVLHVVIINSVSQFLDRCIAILWATSCQVHTVRPPLTDGAQHHSER